MKSPTFLTKVARVGFLDCRLLVLFDRQGMSANELETDLYFYHTDHLGSSSWITDATGSAYQHIQSLPFGEQFIEQRQSSWDAMYKFTGKERDSETGFDYFGARYYDSELSIWLSVDPLSEERQEFSPYNYCQYNPLSRVDPTGALDWKPDKNGNLVAEQGDNAQTLSTYLNISQEEAQNKIIDQKLNHDNYVQLDPPVTAGQTLTLDNVYTQSLNDQAELPDGDPSLYYNCVGAVNAGTHNQPIVNGVGITTPAAFDNILNSDFVPITADKATFGNTAIRFSTPVPFADHSFDEGVKAGDFSRDPNQVGGHVHGAVYYGTSQDGTVYVYTKNGWYTQPKIMKLTELMSLYPDYGTPRGMNGTSGYYQIK